MWNILKTIVPSKSKTTSTKDPLTATQLNESFINDRNELLNNETNNFEDNSTHFTPFTIKEFSIPQIDENSIIQTVEKLPNKATGSDGILAKFVNQFITALLSSLIFLMNLSINTLVFPTAWKIARVSALHKSGSRNDCGNYRPVSVLPFFSKILEKHVYKSFYKFYQKIN